MAIYSGVTADTSQNLQLGAGILLWDFTPGEEIDTESIVGATRGGGSFSAVPIIRSIAADGLPDNVVGFKKIDGWNVKLNVTLIECTESSLYVSIGGGATYSDTAEINTLGATNDISTENYNNIWWIGNKGDGGKVAIQLLNIMNESGVNLSINERGEGEFAVEAIANNSIDDLNTAPFNIYLDNTGVVYPIEIEYIDPEDGVSGAVVNVFIVFNNEIASDEVTVTLTSSGAEIAGTKTYDATGKHLTFTPTIAFVDGAYTVNINEVKDVNDQYLADTTFTFTVTSA